MVLRSYRGLKGLSMGYRELQGFTRDYKGLQVVTGAYKGLQGVTMRVTTKRSLGLQRLTGVTRG